MDIEEHISRTINNQGTYTWTLMGYSTMSDRVGDIIESPEFEVCGKTWQLRIFPGGSLTAHAGYMSYYLASKSSTMTRASYKLMILSQLVLYYAIFKIINVT